MVIRLVGIVLALVTATGCQTLGKSTANASVAAAVPQHSATQPLAALPMGPLGPVPQVNEQQALEQVLPQLQKLALANPSAHAVLLKQLSTTKPSLWALTAERALSTAEYKQQLAVASAPAHLIDNKIVVTSATETIPPSAATTTQTAKPPTFAAPTVPEPTPPSPAKVIPPPMTTTTGPQVIENPHMVVGSSAENSVENAVSESPASQEPTNIRLVSATSEQTERIDRLPSTTSVERPASASSVSDNAAPADWRTSLDAAITVLETTAPAAPHNTEEAYRHARLRLLQLAAGRNGEAVATVPGLPPTEQTYWSKQLYSMSTLLDSSGQPDRQRRAAAAGHHQSEASAQLRQLSSLSLKNLGFCTEVYGFGAYEQIEKPEFTAAQQATLYCEVENYRSDSTERGYHTSLSTSYRIVDSHGTLVDSGEFPLVEDHCLSLRRDFHIQYGVNLPTTVYPGDYRLELTVTDQLGNKIGEDSVAFEIVAK